ncbi:MAG: carbohydrate ABC transporter permease, partial [Ruminococcaceae bacterium]|nr:carbohydrate ABC transporter permease [Oscillospiraceae bacterium]
MSENNVNIQAAEAKSTASNITAMAERDMAKVTAKQRVVKVLVKVALYAFLITMAIIVLFPFYWMLISSVKSLEEYNLAIPTLFPLEFHFENYIEGFKTAQLGQLFLNTLYVGIVSTALSLVVTVISAFAFARLEFRGKNALFAALLATMMIPGELFTITNYQTINNFLGLNSLGRELNSDFLMTLGNWSNTYTVLIVPFLVSVFYIYLLRQNFMQIPNELYLAAKVDGTTDLKYLWKVMIPLALPTIISITI